MALSRRAIEAGDAYVLITALDRTGAVLASVERRLGNFAKTINTLGRNLNIVGAVASVGIGLIERTFASFDDTMRAVKSAITGISHKEFVDLEERAKELGRTTSYTARQVADAMLILARAGLQSESGNVAQAIQDSIESILNLARATGTDLPVATEYAIDILRSFQLPTEQAARVMDVLTQAANASSLEMDSLFEAMKLIGPLAKMTGDSIEEAAAMTGVLANAGIKGSLAGTALRRSFVNLSTPEIQKKLRELTGVEALDADKNLRPLINIMTDIGRAVKELPSAERLGIFEEIFGIRGLVAATNLATARDQFDRLLQVITDSTGVAASIAHEIDAGIGGSIRRVLSALEGLTIQIGQSLAPAFMAIGKAILPGIRSFQLFIQNNEELALILPLSVAGILASGTSLIVFAKALGLVAGVIGVVSFGLQSLAANVRAFDQMFKVSIAIKYAYHLALLGLQRALLGLSHTIMYTTMPISTLIWVLESLGVAAKNTQYALLGMFRYLQSAVAAMLLALRVAAAQAAGLIMYGAAWRSSALAIQAYNAVATIFMTIMGGLRAAIFGAIGTLQVFRGALMVARTAMYALTGATVALSGAIWLLMKSVAIIPVLLAILANPITLLIAAVIALSYAWDEFGDSISKFTSNVAKGVVAAFTRIRETLKGIYDAMAAGNLTLAAKIAGEGVRNALIRFLKEIAKTWNLTVDEMIRKISEWALSVVRAFIQVRNFLGGMGEFLGSKFAEMMGWQEEKTTVYLMQQRIAKEQQRMAQIERAIKGTETMDLSFFNLEESDKNLDKLTKEAAQLRKAQELAARGLQLVPGPFGTTLTIPMAQPGPNPDQARLDALNARLDEFDEDLFQGGEDDRSRFSIGTFSAEMAEQLGLGTRWQQRTAEATEKIVDLLKDQNKWFDAPKLGLPVA